MFYHPNRVEDIQTISYCMTDVLCIVVIVNLSCQSALNISAFVV